MAQQVKFYSVDALPETASTTGTAGIYFVDGGELYKGAQRFGLGRVTVSASTAGVTGAERGDIVVTGSGAGWVYVNSTTGWKPIGGDTSVLQSAWQADISTWTSGLAASGAGSYIIGITQDEDGKVKAAASNFALDAKTAIGDGFAFGSSNGVIVSVTTTSGSVTAVEVTAPAAQTWTVVDVGGAGSYIQEVHQSANGQLSATAVAFPTLATGTTDGTLKLGSGDDAKVSGWDTVKTDITNLKAVVSYSGTGNKVVTADTATFTDLTVTNSATFTATTVSATTLTVGGKTVQQIAGEQIAASTLSGNIKAPGGTSLVTDGQVVNYVSAAIQSFDNAMHYIGTTSQVVQDATTCPTDITGYSAADMKAGDIVLNGTAEYIWNGTKWEKIGDQSAVTGGASTSTLNGVTVEVGTAPATASVNNVTLTGIGTAASMNYTSEINATGSSLPTESAVAAYVSDFAAAAAAKASTGGSYATYGGLSAAIELFSNSEPTITLDGANVVTASANVVTASANLVTAGAVADYVDGKIGALDSNVSSSENTGLQVGVTESDGKITGVTADLVWLNAAGAVIS